MPFQSCKKCGADLTTLIEVKEYCVGCTPENKESPSHSQQHTHGGSAEASTQICHCEHREYWLQFQESNGWLNINFCPNCGKLHHA